MYNKNNVSVKIIINPLKLFQEMKTENGSSAPKGGFHHLIHLRLVWRAARLNLKTLLKETLLHPC